MIRKPKFNLTTSYITEDTYQFGKSETRTFSLEETEFLLNTLDPMNSRNWNYQVRNLHKGGFVVLKCVNTTDKHGKIFKSIRIERK